MIEGVVTTIGDKFHIKAINSKKYVCINQAGRKFTTYLEDVPALIMRQDGKASDVYKNDELFPLLGEPIAPAINIILALQIIAKEKYVFFGNDIQLHDVESEYQRLKNEIDEYNSNSNNALSYKKKISLPKFSGFMSGKTNEKNKSETNSTEKSLSLLKERFNSGEISFDEYQHNLNEIMDNI